MPEENLKERIDAYIEARASSVKHFGRTYPERGSKAERELKALNAQVLAAIEAVTGS